MSVLIVVLISCASLLYCMKTCHERFNAIKDRVQKTGGKE